MGMENIMEVENIMEIKNSDEKPDFQDANNQPENLVENQPENGQEKPNHHKFESSCKKTIRKFFAWFHSLSFPLRVLFSFGVGISFGFTVVCLLSCCISVCRKKTNYKDNLKMYAVQYTSLPQEEKKAEKNSVV